MYEYVSRPDHQRSDRDRLVRRLRRTDDTSASASAAPTTTTTTDTVRGDL
ncbi:hypothetical protein [Streptomyces phaeochromogenes]|nr:hypothetical protein OG478_17250 [Streptomyces phaeochromogenes]